jgi:HK97 family phage portal protein
VRSLTLRTRLNDAWLRLTASSADETATAAAGARKTVMLPSILGPYMPGRAARSAAPKPTAANLRRFAETPVARRALNIVKDRIACMDWQIRVRRGYNAAEVPDAAARMIALRRALEEPNPGDSFRTLFEQAIEDLLVGGFGAVEMEATGNPERPFHLWAVDGAAIEIDTNWNGDANTSRYAQNVGGIGSRNVVPLRDDELMYLRLNPRSHTPFGLGRLEVAFDTINQFLAANKYAGRLASNSVVQYALWLNEATPEQHDRLIHWWQDEIEGTGKVPILSSEQKPEVLRFGGGTDADLRLQWQEFLVRMIANAFDLPPMLLGLQSDVNKATASELADEAFQSAIVPVARLVAEHITRDLFSKRLGWREFEFCFNELDSRNEMEELQIHTGLLKAGVLTVDEVRAMRGLPPRTPPDAVACDVHCAAEVQR